jgi:hypothetical protein
VFETIEHALRAEFATPIEHAPALIPPPPYLSGVGSKNGSNRACGENHLIENACDPSR